MAASANADHDPTFGGILIIVALVIGLLSRNILTKLPVLRKVPYTVRFVVVDSLCWRPPVTHAVGFLILSLTGTTARVGGHPRSHWQGGHDRAAE